MGAHASTVDVAEEEADGLVDIYENHQNGQDLTKLPCAVDVDVAAMSRRISLHLDYSQRRMPLRK